MTGATLPHILAITGASGAVYGLRLAEELLTRGIPVEMVVSEPGRMVLKQECALELSGAPARDREVLRPRLGNGPLTLHGAADFSSPLASGSARLGPMVIAPCSMGTAGRVAHGLSTNLIERAADVALKEGRQLLLLPRETPLSLIHLRNLAALAEAGAVILPPMPAFYHQPRTVEALVDFVVGKALDALGVEHDLFKRWGS